MGNSLILDASEATRRISPALVPGVPVVWINEIHYDNLGDDTGEFIELAGIGEPISPTSLPPERRRGRASPAPIASAGTRREDAVPNSLSRQGPCPTLNS